MFCLQKNITAVSIAAVVYRSLKQKDFSYKDKDAKIQHNIVAMNNIVPVWFNRLKLFSWKI